MKRIQVIVIDHSGIAARLEATRESLGMAKRDFAELMGLDPSSYSKVIKGEKRFLPEWAMVLRQRFGVTLDFIFAGDLRAIDPVTRDAILKHLKGQDR